MLNINKVKKDKKLFVVGFNARCCIRVATILGPAVFSDNLISNAGYTLRTILKLYDHWILKKVHDEYPMEISMYSAQPIELKRTVEARMECRRQILLRRVFLSLIRIAQ